MFVVEVRTRLAFKEKEKKAAEPVLVDVPEAASRSCNLASYRSAVTSASRG